MFPLKVLNLLHAAHELTAEVTPSLPKHTALVVIRPQIDLYYSEAIDSLKPTINERFFVTSEDELANLVLRWTSDLSELCSYLPNKYPLDFDL